MCIRERWIEGHYASRLRVSVPVNMPPEASASYSEMTANDVFVGTWGDKAARVYMSGAGGATVNTSGVLPEGAILNGSYAVRSNNSRTTSIDLTAVSYTHLDVYKRQMLRKRYCSLHAQR